MKSRAISEALRAARKQKGLTQKEVGLKIGVSSQQYGQIENGKKRIHGNRLRAICMVLEIPFSEMRESASTTGNEEDDQTDSLDMRLAEVMKCLDASKKRVLLRTGEALMEEL